jgi:putative membrane protein
VSFSSADHDRVAVAIARAEAQTSGEIVCIVDEQPHRYVGTALTTAALLSFALPLLGVLFGLRPENLALMADWSSGDVHEDLRRATEVYAVAQLLIFLAVAALLWWTPLGAVLTPRAIKRDRVHADAMMQFRARGLENTRDGTGVLIFACMTDRIAEVIADTAIYSRVPPDYWATTIHALLAGINAGKPADGFVDAVTMAGEVLGEHFKPRADDVDELPNRLIEI